MRRLIVAFLSGIFALVAQAGPSFVVGVEDLNYYPQYNSEGKQFTGFAREILDAFAKDRGYSFIYKPLPVARLYDSFLAGELDFKYPDDPNWQQGARKGKAISYSDPVVTYIDGVLVTPDNKGKGKAALKVLGTVRGFTPWDYMGEINKGALRVQEVNDFSSSLQQGMAKRVDGVYMNVDVGNYQLREVLKKPGGLVFDEGLPHTKSAYKLSSLKHAKVIAEFSDFMKKNKAQVDALKKKYQLK